MAKNEYSEYQQKIISNYYNNMDNIMLTKLSELVSELYLAESQKKRNQLWERVRKAMERLEVPYTILEHIIENKDIEVLAKNVQEWTIKNSSGNSNQPKK